MKGRTARAEATHARTLIPLKEQCEQCGQLLWVGYHAHRTVTRLDGLWKLTIVVRRCIRHGAEPSEFGLEVIAANQGNHLQAKFAGLCPMANLAWR